MSVWNPLAAPRLVLQAIGVPGPQVGGGGVASCASAFVSYTGGAGLRMRWGCGARQVESRTSEEHGYR